MEKEVQGFSPEQMATIARHLPAYFEAELAKWMSRHVDKSETHKLVKYPDDTIESASGLTFRQRYVLVPTENLGDEVMVRPFEAEAEFYPHTTLSVTIEKDG